MRRYRSDPANAHSSLLHVVLEDGNLERHHVQSAFENSCLDFDVHAAVILSAVFRMSWRQRKSLYRVV